MTAPTFFVRHRRTLLAATATGLLHLVALQWAAQGLGAAPVPGEGQPRMVEASLLAAAPVAQPEPAAQAPAKPKGKRAPARRPAPTPAQAVAEASPPEPPPEVAEAAAEPDMPSGSAATSPAGETDLAMAATAGSDDEAPEAPATQAEDPAAVAQPAESPPGLPADPAAGQADDPAAPPPVYQVQLPPSGSMEMDVTAKDKRGADWSGNGTLSWTIDGQTYRGRLDAGLSLLVTNLNLLHWISEGTVDSTGLVPRRALEQVRNRPAVAVHFNPDAKRISFSASEHSSPWLPGAQDRLSLLLQLSGIGRADSRQLERGVRILVGEKKDATVWRFVLAGKEDIDTPQGKVTTWHMSRPAVPGAYNARLDVWLAPAQAWLPVRIRNTEANGAVTTQTAKRITLNQTGS